MPDQRQKYDTEPRPPARRESANVPIEQKPRAPINLLKWGLGCSGLAMLLCTGITMFTLILMPVLFSGLDAELQFRIIRRLPFMANFQIRPTPPFNALP